jgi:hypothetical protein
MSSGEALSYTILVEARKDRAPAAILDAMAQECQRLGHRVTRWRGPLSGRMPYGRWIPHCDIAILYNGAHRSYRPALARLHGRGTATVFTELGWHPQGGNYQVDYAGVNALASWAADRIEADGITPLPVRPQGDLLLLLQLNDDTQITERSPWFANMEAFVRFMCRHSRLPVRVRPHPLDRANAALRRVVEQNHGRWDTATSLAESLQRSRAVACINSSAAVEAMAQQIPVLCYGESIYRHEGAVYCLDSRGEATEAATTALQGGSCSLFLEKVAAVVERIVQKQWTIDDVPRRLPELLEQVRSQAGAVPLASITSSDRIEQTICWLTDLPARMLYRRRRHTAPGVETNARSS